ncbi:MAG: helix-hairpin-helix domain-containing protein, partial [Thaumarchaeota archaeon]|nr:helix-hairpin-helix domain-containing protein [Nitrososphaerota archaeon]
LERRLAYGIRRELIDLTRVRGVGRVRARELYRAGYRDRKSLAGADARKVGRISSMGKRVAEAIIAQAGQAGARRR